MVSRKLITHLSANLFFCFAILLFSVKCLAHPMPNSVMLLDIRSSSVSVELQLPLNELELAFGHEVNSTNYETLVSRSGKELEKYILQHIHPESEDGKAWQVKITGMDVKPAEQTATGPYKELIVHLIMEAPQGESSRNFTLNYDVIVHQVVTHKILVAIRQDWDNGQHGDTTTEVGVISLDIKNNVIHPLKISQQPGSTWRGFTSMVHLGMRHIGEGTDHLLFLLTLLLPATLLVKNKRWTGYGGTHYSILRLVKIVTAFTIGHSITLLAGAIGWLHLPSKPVEILIALSILISAIHALRPIFPGRETYIAAGFGLVHGLAFANILVNLHLEGYKMALSILGFNVGIELMQLFVIAITVPWLIILSRSNIYKYFRISGALLAAIAASAWILERSSDKGNIITALVQRTASYAPWLILLMAAFAIASYFLQRNKPGVQV